MTACCELSSLEKSACNAENSCDNNEHPLQQLRLAYPKNVSLGYININSIRNKLGDLCSIVGNDIDVLCIAETKLDPSFPTANYMINGYKKPYRHDVSDSSGGLLTYVNKDIPSRPLKSFKLPDDMEVLVIELNLRKQKWLVLSVYRNPTTWNLKYFIDNLTDLIDYYSNVYENIVILGDFNATPCDTTVSSFMSEHGLYSLINEPTCFKSVGGRCIDLILTNKKHSFQKSHSFETGVSDHHHMIYTMLKVQFVHLPPRIQSYRSYRKFKSDAFLDDLKLNISVSDIGDFSSLNDAMVKALDKHAPFKKRVMRGNHKPHVSRSLRKAIMLRSRLKNKYNKTRNPADFENYRRQRNLVVKLNKSEKRRFFEKVSKSSPNSPKIFWESCKPFFTNKCHSQEILSLIENDEVIQDDNSIAKVFNDYFNSITESLNITPWKPDVICSNIEDIIIKFADHPSILNIRRHGKHESVFRFSHIYPWETYEVIMALNRSKSSGGPYPTKLLQSVAKSVSVPLTDCFNNCISDGTFPDELKLATIFPVFKAEDESDKENYRPISILPTLSKVFEKLLAHQLSAFFCTKFSKFLCGFRAKYSTQTALIRLLHQWLKCLDNSGKIGTILMDLSKAFDCLSHDLLIAKLAAYGLSLGSLRLLQSYLRNRFHRVKIGSALSEWLEILIGVPQGSILGPLLFNIFINDFFEFITKTEVCNFADDNTLYSCASTVDEVVNNLREDLCNALQWFRLNQLVPNPAKFQLMFLGGEFKNISFKINGILVKPKDNVKLLGLTIDKYLKFDKHITDICTKANFKIRCLQRIRQFLDDTQASILCNAFILSNFSYCPITWMYCSKNLHHKINAVQKRALRAVTRRYDLSFDELLLYDDALTIHQRNLTALLSEVYKSMFTSHPEIVKCLFITKLPPCNLRNSVLLQLPPTKSVRFGMNSFVFRGCQLWNSLPSSLKNSGSLNHFKDGISSWVKQNCSCSLCKT